MLPSGLAVLAVNTSHHQKHLLQIHFALGSKKAERSSLADGMFGWEMRARGKRERDSTGFQQAGDEN